MVLRAPFRLHGRVFAKKIMDDIYDAVSSPTSTWVHWNTVGGPPGTNPATNPAIPFLWTVSAPANGAESTYSGVELTWQQILLDNGFGTRMQFTATQTRSYDQFGNFVGAINAAPPTTFTIGLLYDKGPIGRRMSTGITSRASLPNATECTEVPGWPAITDAFDWVTASLHYRFGNGFEIYTEGKNLQQLDRRAAISTATRSCLGRPARTVGGSDSGTGSATAPTAAPTCWVCPGGIDVS